MFTKVLRRAYKKANTQELLDYIQNVLSRTRENPAFAPIQGETTALSGALEHFRNQYEAALTGGKVERIAKNIARDTLMASLDALATALEKNATDDPMYFFEAGFTPQARNSRGARNGKPLSPPEVLRVGSTGRRGELRVQLVNPNPNRVLNYAIEYSLDQGSSWNIGAYQSRSNFTLSELPSSLNMQIRFRAIGRSAAQSVWTMPVSVGVL